MIIIQAADDVVGNCDNLVFKAIKLLIQQCTVSICKQLPCFVMPGDLMGGYGLGE